MKFSDTQEIKVDGKKREALTGRVLPENKRFLEKYAKSYRRSGAWQLDLLLERLSKGQLGVIAYELRNMGIDVDLMEKENG